jgi:hypothetical protein
MQEQLPRRVVRYVGWSAGMQQKIGLTNRWI